MPALHYDDGIAQLYQGDVLDVLRQLPDESVQCCVCSPPYWGLRDYGTPGQLGLEPTPEGYVTKMVTVFAEVRRVLRDDGTLWLNLGDSYALGKTGRTDYGDDWGGARPRGGHLNNTAHGVPSRRVPVGDMKPKDLVGIPWMVAFALRADGWYLRSDIIWAKPNGMPESVTDRPTRSHEYIFLLSKGTRYFYDYASIREPAKEWTGHAATFERTGAVSGHVLPGQSAAVHRPDRGTDKQRGHGRRHAGFNDRWDHMTKEEQTVMGRNKRSVWEVATQPYPEAHFATYPEALIEPCILAGCPEGGTVLDPFIGSGTTAVVAKRLGRKAIGIDLNRAYLDLAVKRVSAVPLPMPLFTAQP